MLGVWFYIRGISIAGLLVYKFIPDAKWQLQLIKTQILTQSGMMRFLFAALESDYSRFPDLLRAHVSSQEYPCLF